MAGMLAENAVLLILRYSICAIGMANVMMMNTNSGATSTKARHFALRVARASATRKGVPSAAVRTSLFGAVIAGSIRD